MAVGDDPVSGDCMDHLREDRVFVLRHAVAQLLFWSAFYYLMPALLPHLLAQSGWSSVAVSGAMSAGVLAWALLSPLAGMVVDRGAAGPAMRLAGFCGAGLLMLAAWAANVWLFTMALVLLGAPMAMTLYDPCFSLMIRRFGAEARRPITLITLIAGFATLLTFPLVGVLASTGLGWRWIMIALAVMALFATAILPSDPRGEGVQHSAPAAVPARVPAARTFALGTAFALLMLGHAALLFQLPAQLADARGLSGALLLPMVLGPAQIAGRLLWERVQGWLSPERAALWLFSVMLVPPLLLFAGGGLKIALLALIVQGGCYGMHTILRPLLAAHWLPGAGFARRLGTIAMIGLLMMGAAPTVAAWVTSGLGLRGLLGLVLLVDLAGLALLAGLLHRARHAGWGQGVS